MSTSRASSNLLHSETLIKLLDAQGLRYKLCAPNQATHPKTEGGPDSGSRETLL